VSVRRRGRVPDLIMFAAGPYSPRGQCAGDARTGRRPGGATISRVPRRRSLEDAGAELLAFWTERHLCTLVTLRRDGSPHVVPVGVTLDPEAGIARVICSRGSQKACNVRATGLAVVSQVDGGRWSTLEGSAVVRDDPQSVAEAVRRYAGRYRQPRVNPERVAIEITVVRVLGTA